MQTAADDMLGFLACDNSFLPTFYLLLAYRQWTWYVKNSMDRTTKST